MNKVRVGLIINPVAGVGGALALKGSDNLAEYALSHGAKPMAQLRCKQALELVAADKNKLEFLTVAGSMGEDLLRELEFSYRVVYTPAQDKTTSQDTRSAAEIISQDKPDLLLFAGGDGTARDICSVVDDHTTVLGIPAGCKIHSGVYSVTPKAAGLIVAKLLSGELLSLQQADVMDIDEQAFRQGNVRAKRYGEMQIPNELGYVQNVKMGGRETDELVLSDIAAHLMEEMDDELFIMGSGSTVAAVMEEMGLENTLLGVDLIQQQSLLASDLNAEELMAQVNDKDCKLVITLIGGQGHIFGRGNQQLSPALLRQIGKENIIILATKSKLKSLNNRPLIIDTGDDALNLALSGAYPIITGYHDHVMYRAMNPEYGELDETGISAAD